ncbi:DUF1491 family protein [Sphingobium subterraneum]|uniref:DUF1491 family protein n=1 Tax=Sphingobium subterraneum TaxID=627688 RepID=A0A841IZK4_9SPHN|nr:DUF1491 family protein [Sphingobium subterraneum]MBB6124093.1 hypothetical protein [Sphingobium subterraneum]
MTDRLASHMLVSQLIRRVQAAGGFATVLRKGDPISGMILIQALEKGEETGLFERIGGLDNKAELVPAGKAHWGNKDEMAQYIARRVRSDPDIWIVELDIPEAERFAGETLA